MPDEGTAKRVDEALAEWRDAERALDEAMGARDEAEQEARTIEDVEAMVVQTAEDAETTKVAAQRAERSAHEAAAIVADISESARDDLERAAEAERSARQAQEAAKAEHRAAQDVAIQRYRDKASSPPVPDAERSLTGSDVVGSGSDS